MFRRRVVFGLAVCLLAVLIVGQTISQPAAQREQRGRQQRDRQGSQGVFIPRNILDMRKAIEDRMQRRLDSSDEEWKILGPSVMKVLELNREVAGGAIFGVRRDPMGRGFDAQGQPTELYKASKQVQKVINNDSAKPEDIEKQLAAYRTAREKVKKELQAEQQKLQKQVNVRQKAQLVLMGLLD